MLSLVLAGGLSTDPSHHYLGQVLNLLRDNLTKGLTYLSEVSFFCFSAFVSEESGHRQL